MTLSTVLYLISIFIFGAAFGALFSDVHVRNRIKNAFRSLHELFAWSFKSEHADVVEETSKFKKLKD